MAIEIIPAILPKSLDGLEGNLSRIRGVARTVQIDICDGVFVPNTTWPYTDRSAFETILSEKEGLPFWEDFDFEIDLMVQTATADALEWVQAGAARIIIHIESADDRGALEALQEFRSIEGGPGVEVALALSLDTPIEKLESLVQYASAIQVMGIARIGFQGEQFDERALERVRELKNLYPDLTIGVDGGVTLENAPALIDAGASRIVVGSAIFTGEAADNYRTFKSLVASV
jgi:ribulose-phosphate 3-epimerase